MGITVFLSFDIDEEKGSERTAFQEKLTQNGWEKTTLTTLWQAKYKWDSIGNAERGNPYQGIKGAKEEVESFARKAELSPQDFQAVIIFASPGTEQWLNVLNSPE